MPFPPDFWTALASWCAASVDAAAPAAATHAPSFFATAEVWCHTVLIWIGFGTLAGLVAKAMMPGRDPGGAVATLLMGVGGSVIGCGSLTYFSHGMHVSPISPLGFVVATGGAFVLLAFYKLLSGRFVRETGETTRIIEERAPAYRRRRRTNIAEKILDE